MSNKLKVIAQLKLKNINAGNATPGGEMAAALGQKQIKAVKFCEKFNELTHDHKGKVCNVQLKLYEDQSYKITYKFTSASQLIFNAINEEREIEAKKKGVKFEKLKGSQNPGSSIVGSISKTKLAQLAKEKLGDTNTLSEEATLKSLIGTAQSMGILVTGE